MNRRAVLIALTMLFAAGLVLRAVEYAPAVPLHQPLRQFPLHVAGWQGNTGFLTPDIVAALHADDYLLRNYQADARTSLGLFIAYYAVQPPDTRIHSPAVCLPGAGWYIVRSGHETIPLPGRAITVNRSVIEKGTDRLEVLYWYQMHGVVAAGDLQAISMLAWTSLTMHRSDEALVRITAPLVGGEPATVARETNFVKAAFPMLERFLPE
jgi:EpsI family protein